MHNLMDRPVPIAHSEKVTVSGSSSGELLYPVKWRHGVGWGVSKDKVLKKGKWLMKSQEMCKLEVNNGQRVVRRKVTGKSGKKATLIGDGWWMGAKESSDIPLCSSSLFWLFFMLFTMVQRSLPTNIWKWKLNSQHEIASWSVNFYCCHPVSSPARGSM